MSADHLHHGNKEGGIDTKKLGSIVRPCHRVTGNRRDSVEGAGWERLFVAINDHARIDFTAMHSEEKKHEAVHNAVAYYAGLGVRITPAD